MSEDVQPPTEAAEVQPEAAVSEVEQPTPIEVTAVKKPKPKRYVKKKVAPPEPPAPTQEEPTAETPIPKAKPKAKPRAKKAAAKDVVIDTVDVQPITPETQEPAMVTEPEVVVVEADTTPDTRTPQQRLSDMQLQMKKLRKEAKQVNYKRMLDGKIFKTNLSNTYIVIMSYIPGTEYRMIPRVAPSAAHGKNYNRIHHLRPTSEKDFKLLNMMYQTPQLAKQLHANIALRQNFLNQQASSNVLNEYDRLKRHLEHPQGPPPERRQSTQDPHELPGEEDDGAEASTAGGTRKLVSLFLKHSRQIYI
jgi:hypothetical protein